MSGFWARASRQEGGSLVNHDDEERDTQGRGDVPNKQAETDPLAMDSLDGHITRREFVITVGTVTGGAILGVPFLSDGTTASGYASDTPPENLVPVRLRINGVAHELSLDPRVTLLDLLRENLAMTGTKKGCDHGQCGACTVLVDGRRINSCLSLAVVHDGEEISTVEGLSQGEELHPLQAAFLEYDGFQCGYCTPGQLCSAIAMLNEAKNGAASYVTADLVNTGQVKLDAAEIRERMSGNICRCGAYPGIVQAIESVYEKS
jgi:xanthine dehydrogenase YagT iron-sulfur-binding subunit